MFSFVNRGEGSNAYIVELGGGGRYRQEKIWH